MPAMSHHPSHTARYIREALLRRPEVAAWPAMRALVKRIRPSRPYELPTIPMLASESVGGDPQDAQPGAAALFCLHTSIHLVDDMLDLDTTGLYRRIGEGATANLALAFQAAGLRVIDDHPLHPARKRALLARLADAAAATAFGQALDAEGVDDEPGYWRVARHKTPPLFEAALACGALLGGATPSVSNAIARLGQDIGLMIQVGDDLNDAMEVPAQPDWQSPTGNLALLYALSAPHDARDRFASLCGRVDEPEMLHEAQTLLATSGAVSYCCYRLAEAHRQAIKRLGDLEVARPEPLKALLDHHVAPLASLFERVGIRAPRDLMTT